jgi:hypothetical protein
VTVVGGEAVMIHGGLLVVSRTVAVARRLRLSAQPQLTPLQALAIAVQQLPAPRDGEPARPDPLAPPRPAADAGS